MHASRLLLMIQRRREVISMTMHTLKREDNLLQDAATKLRLGVSIAEVYVALKSKGIIFAEGEIGEISTTDLTL